MMNMGWSLGYDKKWKRDIGYGVPAYCDYPGCTAEIDRGLDYVCGSEPKGGEDGCGLYFCHDHMFSVKTERRLFPYANQCERCKQGKSPFPLKPEHSIWIQHKLTDESWAEWRAENPAWVKEHTK